MKFYRMPILKPNTIVTIIEIITYQIQYWSMNQKEAKTGQSIDSVKSTLLTPIVAESLLELSQGSRELSVIDVGSGDGSSSNDVVKALAAKGVYVDNLALVDTDVQIFPDILRTVEEPLSARNIQVVQPGNRDIFHAFLLSYEEKFDAAISQLVMHQISDPHKASYLFYSIYRALKPRGELLLFDLHSRYLQYLIEHEPAKFRMEQQDNNRISGEYFFDSGGSVQVNTDNVSVQLAQLLGLGFDLVTARSIVPQQVADKNKRYKTLTDRNIPMFYFMRLRKNPDNFLSSAEGTIDTVSPHGAQGLSITFADQDTILVPKLNRWEGIKRNDQLLLQEIYRKELKMQLLNYWVITKQDEVKGGQLIFSNEKPNGGDGKSQVF